jgi:hypothetical protein
MKKKSSTGTSAKKSKSTPAKAPRKLRYKGQTFASAEALAKHCKINYRTLLSRLNRGVPLADAVKKRRIGKGVNEPRAFTYNGKKYKSLREVADDFGINYSTLRGRVRRGDKIKDAIAAGVSAHEVVVGGKTYKSITEACAELKFNPNVIYSRIDYKWTLDQAFELEPAPFLGPGVVGLVYKISNSVNSKLYIGQTKASLEERWLWHLEHARKKNLNPDGLHHAINAYGSDCFTVTVIDRCGDLRELAELERKHISEYNSLAPNGYNIGKGGEGLRSVGVAVKVKGVKFDSLMSAARAHDINYGTLCDRIDNGWDIEEALLTPAENREIEYCIDGLVFASRRAVAKYYKISVDIIRQREKRGIPIEEIVQMPDRFYREEQIACCSKEFESKSAFAKWFGIAPGTLSYHLKRHPDATAICKNFGKCVRSCKE